MAKYKISGIWKDNNGSITHYAFHTVEELGITRAQKKTKSEAIKLVENKQNEVVTWMWNYQDKSWRVGAKVTVVQGDNAKFLRSYPDQKTTDNLEHLIDYDWISINL